MTRIASAVRDLFRTGLDLTGRMPSQMLLLLVPLLAVLAYGSGTVLLDALTALVTAVATVTKALFWLAALAVTARLLHRLVDQHLRNAPSNPREPVA
ncbi:MULTISPECIES: hypothetical protein [Actinomycetes]|uniref:Uncharacterized protein n=1 Tax=Streptomyces acidiscabies TaxID=42234 RepID=A0ABU4MBW6_9ACTN|nr:MULTISPECIES: hypothetical protein [Actinomycetes]MDX2974018.1 hypothetical protein [Kribbella solani]MDX3025341.1 hypothetical protein [Streptomyces acidiscabies]